MQNKAVNGSRRLRGFWNHNCFAAAPLPLSLAAGNEDAFVNEVDTNPFAASEHSETKSTTVPSSGFGCLTAILGAFSGLIIASWWESRIFAAMRARDPTATIDFLPVGTFWGFVFGGILGLFAGKLYRRIQVAKRDSQTKE
jgi:hypothetical protein